MSAYPPPWHCGERVLTFAERPLIMGVLNVTPDSFSDGGRYADPDAAVAHGLRLAEEGADIIDVGGESTRPGAAEVPEAEERRRVEPVVRALAQHGLLVSIDTRKAGVAQAALRAGAAIVNDVTALRGDPQMAAVARAAGAGVVLMHMRGTPATMQNDPRYENVVADVAAYLAERAQAAQQAGLAAERLALDPGIGFGKTVEHNLALLAALDRLGGGRYPLVVGLSRKSFLGRLTGRPVEERLAASLAGLVYAALRGAQVLRVHDVRESRDALKVLTALRAAEGQSR